jgi:hypothetical protein
MADLSTWAGLLQGTGAIAAATVAGLAVYYSNRTTATSLAAQRDQNRESLQAQRDQALAALQMQERMGRAALLWDRRITAYHEVMDWLAPLQRRLSGSGADHADVMAPADFASGTAVPLALDVRLRLFASGEVLAALAAVQSPVSTTPDVLQRLGVLEAALRSDLDRNAYRQA